MKSLKKNYSISSILLLFLSLFFSCFESDGGTTSGLTGAYYAISNCIVVKSNTEISSHIVN